MEDADPDRSVGSRAARVSAAGTLLSTMFSDISMISGLTESHLAAHFQC